MGVGGEEGEVEEEEEEAVFAAVVGEGERFEPVVGFAVSGSVLFFVRGEGGTVRVSFQSFGDDGEGVPALRLHVAEPVRRDVFVEEGGDAGVEVGAEGAQWGRRVAVVGWWWGGRWDMDDGGGASLCHNETGSERVRSIKCQESVQAE